MDRLDTSGMKRGENDLLAAAYTSTGRGECIVFSDDRGRTWTEFAGNPVVKHQGRDPRLLWHEPTKRWVMAVYDESEGKQWIAFYTSPDLKAWTFRSRIEGFFECPDLFELPVDGDATRRKWVLTAASSEYMVGQFDGATFRPETPKLPGHRGRGFYAAQTFSHDPRGRVVQIGWLQTKTPGMPFNQGMSLPLRLSLRTTPDGPRLAWQPVEELTALRSRRLARSSGELKPGDNPLAGASGELIELRAEFEPGPASVLTLKVRGVEIVHDAAKQEIRVQGHRAPAPLQAGKQRLIVFADRTGLEVFASDGLTYVPMPMNLDAGKWSWMPAFPETPSSSIPSKSMSCEASGGRSRGPDGWAPDDASRTPAAVSQCPKRVAKESGDAIHQVATELSAEELTVDGQVAGEHPESGGDARYWSWPRTRRNPDRRGSRRHRASSIRSTVGPPCASGPWRSALSRAMRRCSRRACRRTLPSGSRGSSSWPPTSIHGSRAWRGGRHRPS